MSYEKPLALEKLLPAQVELGMFIHSLEGPWLSHPFWKRRFLLSDPADLQKLRDSDVISVMIDGSRGKPSSVPEPVSTAKASALRKSLIPSSPVKTSNAKANGFMPLAGMDDWPCSTAAEIGRASRIVEQSRQAVMTMLDDVRLGASVNVASVAPLVDEIQSSVVRNPHALISIVRLKTKDDYTYMHSVAVCALMVNLARQLRMTPALVRDLGLAGLLHDVGKMAVPEEVLNKPDKLTPEEFLAVRTHPDRGHELLRGTKGVSKIVRDVCLHHHEKFDGTGYPFGLKGEQISLHARMGSVCDVYDAVTSNRAYKNAWDPETALARMMSWNGHFDPAIFDAFIKSIGIYPAGGLVRLKSKRLAIVVPGNAETATAPFYRAFYSIAEKSRIPFDDIRHSGETTRDPVVSLEDPSAWGFDSWPEMRAEIAPEIGSLLE